jgi:hypothetical protein
MDYDYNRAAFRTVCQSSGIHPLALKYCSCVLLELSLKQHLNLTSTSGNGGHNLPELVALLGNQHPRYRMSCNALQQQLANSLRRLQSQGKRGQAGSIPSRSYPNMRYLRHSSDWAVDCSTDQDLISLLSLVQRLNSFLLKTMRVPV